MLDAGSYGFQGKIKTRNARTRIEQHISANDTSKLPEILETLGGCGRNVAEMLTAFKSYQSQPFLRICFILCCRFVKR